MIIQAITKSSLNSITIIFIILSLLMAIVSSMQLQRINENSPIELNEESKGFEKGFSSITYPYQEGPDAPYDIRPETLTLSSNPRIGSQFTFNLTSRPRSSVCGYTLNWEVNFNNKVVDYYHGDYHSDCMNANTLYIWKNQLIKLPSSYPSGMYKFNLYVFAQSGDAMDVIFVANL